jgi:hypothetical protein
MIDPMQLQAEFDGDYQPIFIELKKLEKDFPLVHTNQDKIVTDEMAVLINTYASLLYSWQDEDAAVERTPKEIRDALLVLQDVHGFRQLITDLVMAHIPAVVCVIERLYFTNRAAFNYFKMPEGERQAAHKKFEAREWLYPEHRIDRMRNLSRKIWRANVLASAER